MVWYSLVRRSKGAEILADRPRKVQRASKAQHQLLFWQMFVQPAGDLSCDSARARAALIGSTAAISATTSFAALRCIGDAVSTLFWLRFHQHVKVNCIVGISGRYLRAGCSPAFTTSSRPRANEKCEFLVSRDLCSLLQVTTNPRAGTTSDFSVSNRST